MKYNYIIIVISCSTMNNLPAVDCTMHCSFVYYVSSSVTTLDLYKIRYTNRPLACKQSLLL